MNRTATTFTASLGLHLALTLALFGMGALVTPSSKVIRLDFSVVTRPAGPDPVKAIAPPEAKTVTKALPKTPPMPAKPKPVSRKITRTPTPAIKKAPEPKVATVVETTETPAMQPSEPTATIPLPEPIIPATAAVSPPGDIEPTAEPATGSPATMAEQYRQEHFRFIVDHIRKRLCYPILARKNGWQGTVVVSFVINQDGTVRELQVVRSSGIAILDKNALKTVQQAGPFPKPPARAELVIPIDFKLG